MSNQFYILGKACGTKETGNVFPQSTSMIDDYNYKATNSCWNLRHDQFPEFIPNLHAFKLDKKAKITDLISIGSIYFGFLINQNLKKILNEFYLPEVRFYQSYISYKNSINNNYYFLHNIHHYSEKIDFNKTKFYISDSFGNKQTISILNASELNNYYKIHKVSTMLRIITNKYIFKDNYIPEHDLFQISFTDSCTYISHRLKTALEEAKITGIEITPVDFIEVNQEPTMKKHVVYETSRAVNIFAEQAVPYQPLNRNADLTDLTD